MHRFISIVHWVLAWSDCLIGCHGVTQTTVCVDTDSLYYTYKSVVGFSVYDCDVCVLIDFDVLLEHGLFVKSVIYFSSKLAQKLLPTNENRVRYRSLCILLIIKFI